MATFFTNPPNLEPATKDAWVTVDLTTHFGDDAGNVAIAFFQSRNGSGANRTMGLRPVGSTNGNLSGATSANTHWWWPCAVNDNDEVEIYHDDFGAGGFWLIGYLTNDEAESTGVEPPLYVQNSIGNWIDWDLSAHTAVGDDPIFAFGRRTSTASATTAGVGLRPKGATWSELLSLFGRPGLWSEVGTDGVIEARHSSGSDVEWAYSGYVHTGMTAESPPAAITMPGTTGTWTTIDISGIVPADATGVLCLLRDSNDGGHSIGVRPPGSTVSVIQSPRFGGHAITGISDQQMEVRVSDTTNTEVFILGWFSPGESEPPAPDGHHFTIHRPVGV